MILFFNLKKMKDVMVNFLIAPALSEKIDKAMTLWGFATRAEFFRFCAIDFLKSDALVMPADAALNDFSKAIRSVKAAKWLAKRGYDR